MGYIGNCAKRAPGGSNQGRDRLNMGQIYRQVMTWRYFLWRFWRSYVSLPLLPGIVTTSWTFPCSDPSSVLTRLTSRVFTKWVLSLAFSSFVSVCLPLSPQCFTKLWVSNQSLTTGLSKCSSNASANPQVCFPKLPKPLKCTKLNQNKSIQAKPEHAKMLNQMNPRECQAQPISRIFLKLGRTWSGVRVTATLKMFSETWLAKPQ